MNMPAREQTHVNVRRGHVAQVQLTQRAMSSALATHTAASAAACGGSGVDGGTSTGSGKPALRRSMSLQPPPSPMAASAVQQQAAQVQGGCASPPQWSSAELQMQVVSHDGMAL